MLESIRSRMGCFDELVDLLQRALVEEPPVTIKEGGIIREGYHAGLDELRLASRDGKEWLARLQEKERKRTGIDSLKIRFNNVFGYYIEVTKSHYDKVPPDYQRKQTLVNAERFITPELKQMENTILGADERSRQVEYEQFLLLREEVGRHIDDIQMTADAMADLDVLLGLAEGAQQYRYCRPVLDNSMTLRIVNGRHPVIEQNVSGDVFVPNDAFLEPEENRLILLTGPNMAGKSTYIRQVALITLMAQIGAYVPAEAAHIGLVDRIFCRVGASDDLARGQSTFMVEMSETSLILNNATERSLIILDEIGRGTATFDGLSIAWAVAEYLHDELKSRTLFATHYHELTDLANSRQGVQNYNVAVREWKEEIVFLRKIVPGAADKSYGIQVARLAGMPAVIVDRAKAILSHLEMNSTRPRKKGRSRLAEPRAKNTDMDDDMPVGGIRSAGVVLICLRFRIQSAACVSPPLILNPPARPGETDQPVQIGIAACSRLEDEPELWTSYIAVEKPVLWSASQVHGITTEMLADAPSFPSLWPEIRSRLGQAVVVGHNPATERKFLRRFPGHGFGPWLDTLALGRMCVPGLEDYSLSSLCGALGLTCSVEALLPARRWHDAFV